MLLAQTKELAAPPQTGLKNIEPPICYRETSKLIRLDCGRAKVCSAFPRVLSCYAPSIPREHDSVKRRLPTRRRQEKCQTCVNPCQTWRDSHSRKIFDTCEKTEKTGRIVRQLEETREQDGAAEGRKDEQRSARQSPAIARRDAVLRYFSFSLLELRLRSARKPAAPTPDGYPQCLSRTQSGHRTRIT